MSPTSIWPSKAWTGMPKIMVMAPPPRLLQAGCVYAARTPTRTFGPTSPQGGGRAAAAPHPPLCGGPKGGRDPWLALAARCAAAGWGYGRLSSYPEHLVQLFGVSGKLACGKTLHDLAVLHQIEAVGDAGG